MTVLPDRMERDVLRHDVVRWLQRWAEQGWLAAPDPVVVGTSSHGEAIVRVVLMPTPAARFAPGHPWTPPHDDDAS